MRSIIQQSILIAYLIITLGGFLFTTFRFRIPLLPWPLVKFSYALMAPYQGYVPWNRDLLIEGRRPDGTWQEVDPALFFPFIRGEANVRMELRTFNTKDQLDPPLQEQYTRMAWNMWRILLQRGEPYQRLRLSYVVWPKSPEGYDALKKEPFTTLLFLTQVP